MLLVFWISMLQLDVADFQWNELDDELFARLNAFYANHRGLVRSAILHQAVWFFGAIEVWIVFHFMALQAGLAKKCSTLFDSIGADVQLHPQNRQTKAITKPR